jgi:cation diffusion facilitator family transporter
MLILAGSAVIAFAAIRALIHGPALENLGIGIVVIGFAAGRTSRSRAGCSGERTRRRRRLEGDAAHLRTDAYTSIGVLVGLALVSVTGEEWLDPVVALVIAGAIVATGARITMGSFRVLVDEALPDDELEAITREIKAFGTRGVVGYH